MLYLYAIIDKPGVEFELPRGLEDAQLEILPFDGLGAVAGPLSGRPHADAANAHRHMDVLKILMQECTVLPTRFGAVFRKREHLKRAVASLHGSLSADLDRLRGRVEMAIKVVDRSALILAPIHDEGGTAAANALATAESDASPKMESKSAPAPQSVAASLKVETRVASPIYDAEPEMGPGLRYITSRRAESDRRSKANDALAMEVIGQFAAFISDKKWRALPSNSGRPAVTMAFLLQRDQVEAFQTALDELRLLRPKLDFMCTGPWPPYSFLKDEGRVLAESGADGQEQELGRVAS